jgi:hypothetical protein
VVTPQDEVEYRPVEAGAAREGQRRITKGLAAGERVIVEGVQKARPGQKVAPSEAETRAPSPATASSPAS